MKEFIILFQRTTVERCAATVSAENLEAAKSIALSGASCIRAGLTVESKEGVLDWRFEEANIEVLEVA